MVAIQSVTTSQALPRELHIMESGNSWKLKTSPSKVYHN